MTPVDALRVCIEKLDGSREAAVLMLKLDHQQRRVMEDAPAHYSEDAHAAAVAHHITGLFNNIEAALADLVKAVDNVELAGASWHADLLKAASKPTDARSVLVSIETYASLDELRRFRHAAKVNYGHKLRVADVFSNLKHAAVLADQLSTDLRVFSETLPKSDASASPTKRKAKP